MLSPYISKFIQLLKEEVELYEWAKANYPQGYDLENILLEEVDNISRPRLCSAENLFYMVENEVGEYDFGRAFLDKAYWNYNSVIYRWIGSFTDKDDQVKACSYLAKTVNRMILAEHEPVKINQEYTFEHLTGFEEDFKSLPLKEVFLKTKTGDVRSIEKGQITSFANFDENFSFYSQNNHNWPETTDKEELLKWFFYPAQFGDISLQITPYSYTQVGNGDLTATQADGLELANNLIYFQDGTAKSAGGDVEKFKKNIEPLEIYARNVQSVSKYSILDIDINVMLDRLRMAANYNYMFTRQVNIKESISYKLVFSITDNQSVVVPSADMYQAVLFLKATGSEQISLYYDEVEKRVVVKGKTLKKEYTYREQVKVAGKRIPEMKVTTETVEIPTFAIVYEQPIADLTAFTPIDYVEFFNPNLTFRDKYELLRTKTNAPLELPQEFIDEYPLVAATYEQQTEVGLSAKTREVKYEYVQALMQEYLNSYTHLVEQNEIGEDGQPTGKKSIHREAIITEEWDTPDYVLKVNEAYWNYNSQITIEELLGFFISKGNDAGYRMLSMKILGVDYHLFEQAIIAALVETGDVFVSKLDIDEQNVTADIQYQGKAAFVSGNIYQKRRELTESKGDSSYNKALEVFFGDMSSSIYDSAITTVEDAITSRFVPALVPLVKDPKEVKALELNIDISCPIFFKGRANSTNNPKIPAHMKTNLLSTGRNLNTLNLKYSYMESRNYMYGHYELFNQWLDSNRVQIIGEYTYEEIRDAYIYPKKQDNYVFNFVFPLLKDVNKEIVGFKSDPTYDKKGDDVTEHQKLKTNILNATDATKLVLKELGYIASSSQVTEEEAEDIKKKFVLMFKQRYWAARREGRRLFNEFLRKGITKKSREEVDELWNDMYNNYAKPELEKIPIFPSHNYKFGKREDDRVFNLMKAQREGVRHVISRKNSGLLLHEVGFGKTTSSITAISSMINTGESSRILFVVPDAVYDKFQDEIVGNEELYGLLPNANIVLLDNLSEGILKNTKPEKQIKTFTKEELETIREFKRFDKNFNPIIAGLKRKRITFPNDPLYVSTSDWNTAYAAIKKELKKYVKAWEKMKELKIHIEELEKIYYRFDAEFQQVYEDQQEIVNDPESSEKEVKKAEKTIEDSAEKISNRLAKNLKLYVNFVSISLIDDLGSYTTRTMAPKTILIVKHKAASERLRPTKQAVLRGLMFKEGLGDPTREVQSLDLSEWANITGLPQSKCKVGIKILTKHPISLERLNVDTIVVDEIHNFNNIAHRAGAMGWEHTGSKTFYDPYTLSQTGRRSKNTTIYYALEKVRGASKNRFTTKFDGYGQGSDKNGQKLTVASMCLETQYRKKNVNNVILLSATPFTDTPFQVLSVLGMANYEMLQENGIKNAWDFFNNYVDETYKYMIRWDGAYGLFVDIGSYYNDKALSNLITNVSNVKITDEKIEASRPKKAIIPANKMKSDDESEGGESVSATTSMGDTFRELEFVNSRVQLSENQLKFQADIQKYIEDDNDQRPIKQIFPIKQKRDEEAEAEALAEELTTLTEAKIQEANEDKSLADIIVTHLQGLYEQGKYAQHPILEEAITHIKVKILKEKVEKAKTDEDEDELEAVAADTTQMEKIEKLKGKAIGAQQAQQALVISPYFINLGSEKYSTEYLPDLEPDPATVFVEQSPKLMFVVESIKQTIAYQKEQLAKGEIEKIGGQVVYFDKHNFGYGGKNYNAFELLAEYIAKNVDDISSDKDAAGDYVEIATVDGSTPIDDAVVKGSAELDENGKKIKGTEKTRKGRKSIKNGFNDGTIKILIGSKAIKEGIDLQGNSHTMYICEAEFSPEVAMQLEGRIWRQKNPYDVVRIVYVLAMNTVDSFVYSKINRKVNQIKRMLEAGVYEMNTTQFVIDTKEMLLELNDDPDKLTEIQYQDEIDALKEEMGSLGKVVERLKKTKEKYEDVENDWEAVFGVMNKMYPLLVEARIRHLKDSKDVRGVIKAEKSAQKILDYEQSGYKGAIDEWAKDKKSNYDADKYKITEKELDDRYLAWIEKNPTRNPLKPLPEPLSMNMQYSQIEKVVIAVKGALSLAENVENNWRRMSEEEQQAVRDKERKNIGEMNWLAFFDTTGSMDLAAYMRRLQNKFIDDVEDINVVQTYQEFIKNAEGDQNLDINDIDSIIATVNADYEELKRKVSNEDEFKAELREEWVVAIEKRREVSDGSTEALIESMEESLPLIRLRTEVEKADIMAGK